MTNGYKKQIAEKIKNAVNDWIDDLKNKHQDLLITKQWNILFPKGFQSGFNILPVVTSAKHGKHLVAEIQFVLPDTLELDIDQMELILKNEPYIQEEQETSNQPSIPPLNDSIDLLNDIVLGLNSFLQNTRITIPRTSSPLLNLFGKADTNQSIIFKSSEENKTHTTTNKTNGLNISPMKDETELDRIKISMKNSPDLPDWIRTIESREIWNEVLDKLAQAYIHYNNQLGYSVDLKTFFEKYTQHLLHQNKLHHYCTYKSKPVRTEWSKPPISTCRCS